MSDTPETDHLENNLSNAAHPALLFLSRKIERERDRALADLEFRRDLYKLQSERLEGIERERDEAVRSCHIWQKGHAELVAERDKYWEQITYLLDRLGNAERGFWGSNKRLFTSPFTDPQLPVVNSFSGDAMKIIAHKKHE